MICISCSLYDWNFAVQEKWCVAQILVGPSGRRPEFHVTIQFFPFLFGDEFPLVVLDEITLLPRLQQALELFRLPFSLDFRVAFWTFRVLIVEAIVQTHSRSILKESVVNN